MAARASDRARRGGDTGGASGAGAERRARRRAVTARDSHRRASTGVPIRRGRAGGLRPPRLDTVSRSAADIRRRWSQLKPTYTGSPYAVAPTLVAPYARGSLAPGFLQDGLNAINYTRYLAGLPDDVTLEASFVDRAQHGSVLLAVGQFAHSQPKPSDMPQDFYDIANAATSSSNIGWGYPTLAASTSAAWTTATRPTSTAWGTVAGCWIRRCRRPAWATRTRAPIRSSSTGAGWAPSATTPSSGRARGRSPSRCSPRERPGRSL